MMPIIMQARVIARVIAAWTGDEDPPLDLDKATLENNLPLDINKFFILLLNDGTPCCIVTLCGPEHPTSGKRKTPPLY